MTENTSRHLAPVDDHESVPEGPEVIAERAVLGTAIQSPEGAADALALLRPELFSRNVHQVVFEAVQRLSDAGNPVDPTTVLGELARMGMLAKAGAPGLGSGGAYLHSLMQRAGPVAYHAPAVLAAARQRNIIAALRSAEHVATGPGFDPDVHLEQIRKIIDDATAFSAPSVLRPNSATVMEVLAALETETAPGLPTGYPDLDDAIGSLRPGEVAVIAGRPGGGKALALDTPLPTPDGWTTMGDVRVGDYLIGADGKPSRVTAATDVMHEHPCYEVEFSDGTVIVADADHLWHTTTRASRRSEYDASLPKKGGPFASDQSHKRARPGVCTTKEIAETLRCGSDGRANHAVPVAVPLILPERELPLGPYVLGAWLGDGNSNGSGFTTADPEMVTLLADAGVTAEPLSGRFKYHLTFGPRAPMLPVQERICVTCGEAFVPKVVTGLACSPKCRARSRGIPRPPQPTCSQCGAPTAGVLPWSGMCSPCWRASGTVHRVLRSLGVLNSKHIPTEYLRASESQRRALLAGLLDTDGTAAKAGSVVFCVTSRQLAEDTRELIASLGYRCGWREKRVRGRSEESSTAFTLTFTTADDVFRLGRKRAAHEARRRSVPRPVVGSRYITDVREVASVPVRCVQVDAADHLYLASRSMIPTHNSLLGFCIADHVGTRLGLPVLFSSLEMTETELTARRIAATAKVPLHDIVRRQVGGTEWDLIDRAIARLTDTQLHVDDTAGAGLAHIRGRLRSMARTGNAARLLVIDYLGYMAAPRAESRQQAVAELARGVKIIAREFSIPVILAAQLNRGPEHRSDKVPAMADLRESGEIEQSADIVILLNRPDGGDPESPRAGEIDLIIDKNRQGRRCTVTLLFQGHYGRIVSMSSGWSPAAAIGGTS